MRQHEASCSAPDQGRQDPIHHKSRLSLILLCSGLLLLGLLLAAGPAAAQAPGPDAPSPGIDNKTCLSCHNTPGMETELPTGEPLYLTVDQIIYRSSSHGRLGYACVQCHTDITEFPHRPVTAENRREYTRMQNASCERCHADKFDATQDNAHAQALEAGHPEAAVCSDCHGSHDVGPPDSPRSRIPHTCERCHSEIYKRYEESVHGAALFGEGNPDVPSCTDCHGSHEVAGPSSSPFRLFSPEICLECHADPELMDRYGLSTAVGETYLADFHGTTVLLFEKTAPDQETNKPVCIDCHGVHDMRPSNDPNSTVIKENLLVTCQKCHPDATTNFPAAWLGHYEPSVEEAPLVFAVNLFYMIVIPVTIGGMAIFVVLDGSKRIRERRRNNHTPPDSEG